MLCLSRVSVSRPAIRPADLLEASRLCFTDSKANMLHGKHTEQPKTSTFNSAFISQVNICVFFVVCGCRFVHPGAVSDHRHETPQRRVRGRAVQPADGSQRCDAKLHPLFNQISDGIYLHLYRIVWFFLFFFQSLRSSCRGSRTLCTILSSRSSWRSVGRLKWALWYF